MSHKDNQQPEKILIIVRGGVVQSVFASNLDLKVDLLDFDNEYFPNTGVAMREFEMRKINLTEILF